MTRTQDRARRRRGWGAKRLAREGLAGERSGFCGSRIAAKTPDKTVAPSVTTVLVNGSVAVLLVCILVGVWCLW